MAETIDELLLADAAAWRQWLADNHRTRTAVWIVLAKKGAAALTSLAFDDALAEAVCYGWIDNKTMRRDETTYRIRFTPRRPGGTWSRGNVRLAEALIASGRMQAAGLAEVERARAEGRYRTSPP